MRFLSIFVPVWVAWFLLASPALSLVFEDEDIELLTQPPPFDFPYWEHVTQRRYDGPSVVYLGAGWAITARHVGRGEIFLNGEIYAPNRNARHTLLNNDGSAADIMVFQIDESDGLPDLPLLPIAKVPPQSGEDVLMVGFGKVRRDRIELGEDEEPDLQPAFRWTEIGEKRWGRNRVESNDEWLVQKNFVTRSFVTRFDRSTHPRFIEHEATATVGDSGGAVFVRRDGEWKLAGLMTSITSPRAKPAGSSAFGDLTYSSNLAFYREEILRWARPRCANGLDDDGDGRFDHPDDPDCNSVYDDDERTLSPRFEPRSLGFWTFAILGLIVCLWSLWRVQRGRRTERSTSNSSAP